MFEVSLKLTLHKMKQEGIERAEPAVGNGTDIGLLAALKNAPDLHDDRTSPLIYLKYM